MAASILNQGLTDIRDSISTKVTYVGVSTDSTAFSASQTRLDPTGTATNLIKSSTSENVDFQTVDEKITINGDSEFTNSAIMTIGALKGSAATDCITRSVRGTGLGIGVQAGDQFTIGVRFKVEDNS